MDAHTAIDRLLNEDFPEHIDPVNFGLEDDDKNRQMLAWLKAKHPTVVGEYNGVAIRKAGNNLFVEGRAGLSYLVRFKDDRYGSLGLRYVTQVAVWRRGGGYVTGIASHIFWSYLFPIHGTVISDAQQTAKGETFWSDRAQEAFERGLHVCFADLMSGRIRGLSDEAEFRRSRAQVYGDAPPFPAPAPRDFRDPGDGAGRAGTRRQRPVARAGARLALPCSERR